MHRRISETEGQGQPENIICRLCFYFEAEKSGDYFVVAKCGHIYHFSCIRDYLDRGRFVCPTCNRSMHLKKLTKLYGVDPFPQPLTCSTSSAASHIYSFKLALLGSSGAGKSCLLRRFYDNSFDTRISYTGGTDLVRKTIHMGDGIVQLIIWDTIGQDKFKSVISTCVRDAQGIIFVFDVGKKESFEAIEWWWEFAETYGPKNTVKILVGNKTDLEKERIIKSSDGEELALRLNIPYFETSAKADHNVEEVFRTMTGTILQNDWILSALQQRMSESTVKLHHSKLDYSDDEPITCFQWFTRGFLNLRRAFRSNSFH